MVQFGRSYDHKIFRLFLFRLNVLFAQEKINFARLHLEHINKHNFWTIGLIVEIQRVNWLESNVCGVIQIFVSTIVWHLATKVSVAGPWLSGIWQKYFQLFLLEFITEDQVLDFLYFPN